MLAGAEMASEGVQMSAEKVQEDVMDELPTLTGSQLLELCEMVEVDVKEEFKGKNNTIQGKNNTTWARLIEARDPFGYRHLECRTTNCCRRCR